MSDQFSYSDYDRLTRTFINEHGKVDYGGLKKDLRSLGAFIDLLAAISPENRPELFPTEDERMRYYLTAYNALILFFAASAYPKKHTLWSRLGYFKDKDIVLGGRKLTLNELEHGIIRKQFLDPRIHFYLNCGARSCPKINMGAIVEKTTEKELEEAAMRFINDSKNARFDQTTSTLYLSKIFDWYSKDFINYLKARRGLEQPHISQYIAMYLSGADGEALSRIPANRVKIKYMSYDKGLNEQ